MKTPTWFMRSPFSNISDYGWTRSYDLAITIISDIERSSREPTTDDVLAAYKSLTDAVEQDRMDERYSVWFP